MAHPLPMSNGHIAPQTPGARRNIRIHTESGETLDGKLTLPQTRAICEILNDETPFLKFETSRGETMLMDKMFIQTVRMLD